MVFINSNVRIHNPYPIQTAVFCPLPLNAGDLDRREQFSILSDERGDTNNDVDILVHIKSSWFGNHATYYACFNLPYKTQMFTKFPLFVLGYLVQYH